MTKEFHLPDIGEGVMEGEIVKWHVDEGQKIEEGQLLVEVLTDKASVEITSPFSGTVLKHMYAEGDIAGVETVIVVIGEEGEALPSGKGTDPKPVKADTAAPAAEREVPTNGEVHVPPAGPVNASPSVRAYARANGVDISKIPTSGPIITRSDVDRALGGGNGSTAVVRPQARSQLHLNDKILAPPAVRALAKREDVDLKFVPGSGPEGRIRRTDVETYAASGTPTSAAPALGGGGGAGLLPRPGPDGNFVVSEPLRGVRRVIANQMVRSKTEIPHFTYVEDVDMTEIVSLRAQLKEDAANRGVRLTVLPFVMRAVISAARQNPAINAHLVDGVIHTFYNYHIGIAAATPQGLKVPVVKDAETMTLYQLATAVSELGARAKENKLKVDELKGSTFTITSLGRLGGVLATPIINYPEVAILGVHKITKKPVWDGSQFVPRDMMNLSVSVDHRACDGIIAAEFLASMKHYLENPGPLIIDMLEG